LTSAILFILLELVVLTRRKNPISKGLNYY